MTLHDDKTLFVFDTTCLHCFIQLTRGGFLYHFDPYLAIPFTLQNGMAERDIEFQFFPEVLHGINDTLTGTFAE